ncbi:YeeE/YedE thiosulfate transporter family protein [Flavobacteriaceae bacterium]|jgi:uncharacterized protein|nr:YeeE/YedE thiosulfate transporter family protein [Flavobacteriaceae bacterium]MDB4118510.1 YeeE/YedE thiosulfate transporter family protein [Flavobacteriaceae bacterium]
MRTLLYFSIGILFGITMFKSEAASWFRIYEMFQFNAFHMYGIIGSALFCGAIITFVLKKFNVNSVVDGEPIVIPSKESGWKRYLFGGVFFGFGWAISGACPGPMFTVLGAGFLPILVVIASATLGTFCYGLLQKKLPH